MKLKLIANPRKDWAEELQEKLSDHLKSSGHEIVASGADATICIGGDGTILYANHSNMLEGPVAGIGTKKSYICQVDRENWKGIYDVLKRKTVKIMTIKATVNGKEYSALNDFVFHAKDYRVITIKEGDSSFRGDGIIISTALGSASYAYSAGAEILPPESREISVVPICPYRRASSPKIVSGESKIPIETEEECAFIADGIFVANIKQKVNIEKGDDVLFFEGVGKYK